MLSSRGDAQTPSLSLSSGSGAPGGVITVTVGLSYNGGTRPAAVQWDLSYSIEDLGPSGDTFFSTGAAASAAGKTVACSVLAPGNVRCIVSGLNKAAIADGTLASVRFQIAATRSSSTTVSILKIQGADRTGAPLKMRGGAVSIAIAKPQVSLKVNSGYRRLPSSWSAAFAIGKSPDELAVTYGPNSSHPMLRTVTLVEDTCERLGVRPILA